MVAAPPEPFSFADIGRIPAPGDNVAIATRTLPAGSRILLRQLIFELSHTILEGHRFAIFRIRKGDPLLSWGLPFGLANRNIEPGEYVCNEKILRALAERHVQFELPAAPNFLDYRLPFELDAGKFRPGQQVAAPPPHPTFQGFQRNAARGVGTRNYIVVLGTNSRTGAFARSLAARFENIPKQFPNIDGVVPIAHTEGGTASRPHNFELTLRTLAGFMVNPNVGAVLCIDYGSELLSNAALQKWLRENNYLTDGLLHDFISIGDSSESAQARAEAVVRAWLPQVNEFRRESVPVSHLRLGLQCGGSDAFSGVSANPLVGILSRETVARGGSANLAETDELIGAESYVLANVRDLATAKSFLEKLDRFQKWAALHGHTAEGNPSGGNNFRGLYNIAIKSIGAARKKDPATRLDYVIDFAQLMSEPGFYFMNSPGNDLESIAGQVAAGCNMILFATGNGSITNFPFVPTIKIMTTTRRFELVRNEMDFNGGRYQDGESMEDLGREAFDYMLKIASGQPSAGEKAGHSQVQLWREWRANPEISAGGREAAESQDLGSAAPNHVSLAKKIIEIECLPRIALILPTSLCSGQISLMIADRLNRLPDHKRDFDRAVALPHTEGCGNSGGESERLFLRTMAGYLAHPFVSRALLLEHGCEKTHNDAFRNTLRELNLPEARFGFRSIQLDGGIERVTAKSIEWFQAESPRSNVGQKFAIALHGRNFPRNVAASFGILQSIFLDSGATVILSELSSGALPGVRATEFQTVRYGERFPGSGGCVMDCPTDDDLEIVTGLAATGAQLILVFEPDLPLPSNPLVPTVQLASRQQEADLVISDSLPAPRIAEDLLRLIFELRSGKRTPVAQSSGNIAFQITRGYEGISL
jgi:altronate dehydratase